MSSDIFRPRRLGPAQRIYDEFQRAAAYRAVRDDWEEYEMQVVHAQLKREAHALGVLPPTREQLNEVDRSACGHSDYGAKLALGCARLLREAIRDE